MAVYVVTGTLGSGKSLLIVKKIQEYLMSGRRVVTNLDIKLEALCPAPVKRDLMRISDWPSAEHLDLIGDGYSDPDPDSCDESRFGAVMLDEAGTFLNAREYSKDGRKELIDWFRHARKLRWDIFLIVQEFEGLDKQVRKAISEHLVVCKRGDRFSIPGVSSITALFGLKTTLPKVHFALVRYGTSHLSPIVARWFYRARDLYPAYRTRQAIMGDYVGLYSVLDTSVAPWLLEPSGLREWMYDCLAVLRKILPSVADLFPVIPASAHRYMRIDFLVHEAQKFTRPPPPARSDISYADWLLSSLNTENQGHGGD